MLISQNNNIFRQVLNCWVLHGSFASRTPRAWQGSVATCFRYGGIFKNNFIANLLLSLTVEEFWKSVNIWRSYMQEYSFWVFINSQCRCRAKPNISPPVCATSSLRSSNKFSSTKLQKKTDMLRSNSKQSGESCSQSWRRKRKAAVGRICRKGCFKSGMKERVGDGRVIIISSGQFSSCAANKRLCPADVLSRAPVIWI